MLGLQPLIAGQVRGAIKMRNERSMQDKIAQEMTKAEQDAQNIRQRDEQIKRLQKELHEYIKAEDVLIAAGLIAKAKVEQAHDIVRGFPE
jgi:hypothetical protein